MKRIGILAYFLLAYLVSLPLALYLLNLCFFAGSLPGIKELVSRIEGEEVLFSHRVKLTVVLVSDTEKNRRWTGERELIESLDTYFWDSCNKKKKKRENSGGLKRIVCSDVEVKSVGGEAGIRLFTERRKILNVFEAEKDKENEKKGERIVGEIGGGTRNQFDDVLLQFIEKEEISHDNGQFTLFVFCSSSSFSIPFSSFSHSYILGKYRHGWLEQPISLSSPTERDILSSMSHYVYQNYLISLGKIQPPLSSKHSLFNVRPPFSIFETLFSLFFLSPPPTPHSHHSSSSYSHVYQSSPLLSPLSEVEVPISPSYRISFSLWNEGCGNSWNFSSIFSSYLFPFLSLINQTARLSFQSQVLHYVPLSTPFSFSIPSISPSSNTTQSRPNDIFFYEEASLPNIYPSDLLFEDFSHYEPTIHLVAYIPSLRHLYILLDDSSFTSTSHSSLSPEKFLSRLSRTNSFILSKKGGFSIMNPPSTSSLNDSLRNLSSSPNCCRCPLNKELLHSISSLFISQLRILFGLEFPSSLPSQPFLSSHSLFFNVSILRDIIRANPNQFTSNTSTTKMKSPFLSLWELDNLSRKRTIDYFFRTLSIIHSLDLSLSHLPSIVVSNQIEAEVRKVISLLKESLSYMEDVSLYNRALSLSLSALNNATSSLTSEGIRFQFYRPLQHKSFFI